MAIILISRGTMSGGKALAEKVADRLGYPCLSREETVRETVAKYGISEEEMTAAMNDPPPFWQQVHGKRISYVRVFSAVLLEHVRGENLVYHGHAAHLMLSSLSRLLRVRVIADSEFRIKGAMARRNLSREEAIAFIQKIDRKRDLWTRFLYGVEWKDASLYDVTFNLEQMGTDAAADTIVYMANLDAFQPTPQSRKKLDDLILGSRVWSALLTDGKAAGTGITVTADGGEVLICGGASSTKSIDSMAAIAKGVDGVRGVRCEVGLGSDWYW